jgi:hypothetical protein
MLVISVDKQWTKLSDIVQSIVDDVTIYNNFKIVTIVLRYFPCHFRTSKKAAYMASFFQSKGEFPFALEG